MLARIRRLFDAALQSVVVILVVALTTIVVVAVVYRKAGASLSWYDEVASVLLAWVTYYGAALAALKRQHIGFDGIVLAVAPPLRLLFVIVSEACVFTFFILLAWTGWIVLGVLEGDTLVSLPQVSVQITQSVIPLGAVLFVICEAFSLPDHWRRVRDGVSHEIADAVGGAEGPPADREERAP